MARIARQRTDPEETRARIIAVAEEQFRRVGFAKTTVSDIAAALAMSPANVYRFFPSKAAIVEVICGRCMREHEEIGWAVARMKTGAAERLEQLTLDVFRHTLHHVVEEQRMHDMLAVAFEQNWEAIHAHLERMQMIMEAIIRDGIAAGELETEDPALAATCFQKATIIFCHPQLVAQCSMFPEQEREANARAMVRMLVRAMRPAPSG